jgi:hypothetical protein
MTVGQAVVPEGAFDQPRPDRESPGSAVLIRL